MNKLLSIALASALFATTGFASTALTIAEHGEVDIVGNTTANITENAGTLDIAAGATLTDTKIENSGIIKIRVNDDGNAYGHIQNEYAETAYTIEQRGWNPDTNMINGVNKGAAEGTISLVKSNDTSASIPVTCKILTINANNAPDLEWQPELTSIFGDKFIITATKPAVEGENPSPAVTYQLDETALQKTSATGSMQQMYIGTQDQVNKFFGRLNVQGLNITVEDPNADLRALVGHTNDEGEIEPVVLSEGKTMELAKDETLKATITGDKDMTFTKSTAEGATPKTITLDNDMSGYAGKLTTDGNLVILGSKALPAGDMDITGELKINAVANSETHEPLELKGTAPVEADADDNIEAEDAKIHTVKAGSINLVNNFKVGAYGKLILGSN